MWRQVRPRKPTSTRRVNGKLHTFTIDELVVNLKRIIGLNPQSTEIYEETTDEITLTPYMVIAPDRRRGLFQQQKKALQNKLYAELVKAQRPAAAPKAKKDTALPSDPHFLVGKRVEHKFNVVEKDGRSKMLKRNVWYSGIVESIAKLTENIFETVYRVTYDMLDDGSSDCESDEETQSTFEYQLLIDYVDGDLRIVEELPVDCERDTLERNLTAN